MHENKEAVLRKLREISQMIYSEDFECIEKMEIKRYDKNSFHLPRQYMPFDNGAVCPTGHGK